MQRAGRVCRRREDDETHGDRDGRAAQRALEAPAIAHPAHHAGELPLVGREAVYAVHRLLPPFLRAAHILPALSRRPLSALERRIDRIVSAVSNSRATTRRYHHMVCPRSSSSGAADDPEPDGPAPGVAMTAATSSRESKRYRSDSFGSTFPAMDRPLPAAVPRPRNL